MDKQLNRMLQVARYKHKNANIYKEYQRLRVKSQGCADVAVAVAYNAHFTGQLSIISLHFGMNNKETQIKKGARSRIRCYSSMNYQEYKDFFGTPPKMPQAPNAKPQEDPIDIPELCLELEATDQSDKPTNNNDTRIPYKIETIPEVDSSQANSLGLSPRVRMDFFQFNSVHKMEKDGQDSQDLVSVKRSRNRPRSYSQNSTILPKFRIIDFLNQTNNKGRKQPKLE